MPKISESTMRRIKEAASIVEVAGDLFPDLKKAGESWKARSPLTGEKTPSLTFFPKTNTFVDYSAGGENKGDVIKLVMIYNKMNFLDAIGFLAQKYNIPLYTERGPNLSNEEKEIRAERYQEIIQWAYEVFEKNLWEDPRGASALDYLVAKGFNEDTLKLFHVGYAADSYNELLKAAHQKGYSNEELFQVGLINSRQDKEGKRRYYDTFRHRIMFPYFNDKGQACGFTARLLSGSKTNFKDAPKYVNTKETKVFTKGSLMYGVSIAKESIRANNLNIIMEGPTDVIAMHQAGFKNVVCGSGTAFTEKHLQALSRYSPNFLTLFDGDSAGRKATSAVVDILLTGGGEVEVALVPDSLDPQELIMMRGVKAMEDVIASKVDVVEYRAKDIQAAESSPSRKAKAINQLVRTVCFISDAALRFTYLEKCAKITGIPLMTLQEMEHNHLQVHLKKQQALVDRMGRVNFVLTQPRELLRLILRNSKVKLSEFLNFSDFIIQAITEADYFFSDSEDRYLYNQICALRLRDAGITLAEIKEADMRAYYHAGKIIGAEKYSVEELKFKVYEQDSLNEVFAICLSRLLQAKIKSNKELLLTEDEEEVRGKLERVTRTLEMILRHNKELTKKYSIL